MIHDHLQQALAGARIKMEVLRLEGKTLPIARELKVIDGLLAEALEAARTLTTELSPAVLYRSGLTVALRWLARWFEERNGLAVEVEAATDVDAGSEDVRIILFRSVNELLFNIVKHANVKRASIHIGRTDDGAVRVVVSDEGAGFDPEQARAEEGTPGGFGLFSVRERLELLGGGLCMESAPGRGTRITLTGPPAEPASIDPEMNNGDGDRGRERTETETP
jgi:signal transduction histidine kinase